MDSISAQFLLVTLNTFLGTPTGKVLWIHACLCIFAPMSSFVLLWSTFFGICSLVFPEILDSSRNLKKKKSIKPGFPEKFQFSAKWPKGAQKVSKIEFFYFFIKLCHDLFCWNRPNMREIVVLFSCANFISEKILVHKSQAKMFSSNQIIRLFDHQYFWKQFMLSLIFCMEILTKKKLSMWGYIPHSVGFV